MVYYNENDPKAAAWLRELIKAGLIAKGEVDERSIIDVRPTDLVGYRQCHFFAGIGGWSYALRLAGWSDDRPVWTGSCPCQKHSSAARGRNVAPDLWPPFLKRIAASRPRVVFGEQVAKKPWIDRVCNELEALDYAVGAAILPACSVGFDHARPRVFFVGHSNRDREPELPVHAEMDRMSRRGSLSEGFLSSNGLSDRVALSRLGNAIVPQVAAEFIAAYMEIAN